MVEIIHYAWLKWMEWRDVYPFCIRFNLNCVFKEILTFLAFHAILIGTLGCLMNVTVDYCLIIKTY